MNKKYTYKTYLIKGRNNGIFADFPYDSKKEFGTRKAVRVNLLIDEHPYNMSLLPKGDGNHWLHIRMEIRKVIHKEEGDEISIVLERDLSTPELFIPEYLQWLLDEDLEMKTKFEKISFSTKKFWLAFIDEPKNDTTKVERINKFFDFLIKNSKT